MPTPFREQEQKNPGMGPIMLFILPLPLLIVVVQSLISGSLFRLIAALGSLIGLWLAARFIKNAYIIEWQSTKRAWARSSRTPWRFLASVFTGCSVFAITLMLLQHNIVIAVVSGLLAFAGILLRYGFDPQHDKNKDVSLVGVTSEELIEIFDEAENHLKEIENAANSIQNIELKGRLRTISSKTREILGIIEKDPKDLRRARKFLKVYLKGAKAVSSQYANTPQASENEELQQNLRNVLTTIEEVIEEQKVKLLENDLLDLDVKIEVLEAQLKHEGVI